MAALRSAVVLAVALITAGCTSADVVRPSPSPTPASSTGAGVPVGPIGAGTVRIKDDLGGWALDVPADWWTEPSFQHGYDLRSYDPTVAAAQGAALSGHGGVLVTIRMRQNPKNLDPRHYYMPEEAPDLKILDHAPDHLAGQYSETWLVWHEQVAAYEWMEPTFRWFLRSPFFDDRMVVITVAPGDSDLQPEVRRIMQSLQFYQPAPPPRTPILRRDEVLRSVLRQQVQAGASLSRVETKLVRYKRVEAGMNAGQDLITEPDTLVWAVVMAGSDLVCGSGSLRCSFTVAIEAARPPEHLSRRYAMPEWPEWFEFLIDLEYS